MDQLKNYGYVGHHPPEVTFMLPTLEQYGLDRLSVEERIALAHAIWDSLPTESRLSDAQRAELQRRLADDDAHPNDAVTWEEIKAAALRRWGS